MLSQESLNHIFSIFSEDQDYLKWEVDPASDDVRVFLDISEVFQPAQFGDDGKEITVWDEFTDNDIQHLQKAYSMLAVAGEASNDKYFYITASLWLNTLYASIKHREQISEHAAQRLHEDANEAVLRPLFREPWNASVDRLFEPQHMLFGVSKWLPYIGSVDNIGYSFMWRKWGESDEVTFFAVCSDQFAYACADAEEVTEENKHFLKTSREQLEALNSTDDPTDYMAIFYPALFSTHSRRLPVIQAYFTRIFPSYQKNEQLAALFTAASAGEQ